MKYLPFLGILIFAFACRKTIPEIEVCPTDFERVESFGNIINSITKTYHSGHSFKEIFVYGDDGKLESIDSPQGSKVKVFEYNQERLIEIKYFSHNEWGLYNRDSLVYDIDQNLKTRYHIKSDSILSNKIHSRIEYEYDASKNLIKRSHFEGNSIDFKLLEKFDWEDGNIIHSEQWDQGFGLMSEFFYKYDNKLNYRLQVPLEKYREADLSLNNQIWFDYKDYIGNLDIFRFTSCTFYIYNKDNLPVEVVTPFPVHFKIKYIE